MLIETFEDFINRLDFNLIIRDPSKFLLDEFNIQLSNIQLIVILTIVALFFAELTIRNINKKKQDTKEKITLKKIEKSNEISSDVIRQKIDLAIAYMNMEKKGKAITLLKKLEKYQLTKKQLKQISQLRNRLT
jgi:DNA integrity scanning protein DisA with diadenylate cyclase activity